MFDIFIFVTFLLSALPVLY